MGLDVFEHLLGANYEKVLCFLIAPLPVLYGNEHWFGTKPAAARGYAAKRPAKHACAGTGSDTAGAARPAAGSSWRELSEQPQTGSATRSLADAAGRS